MPLGRSYGRLRNMGEKPARGQPRRLLGAVIYIVDGTAHSGSGMFVGIRTSVLFECPRVHLVERPDCGAA
jgi:hypothetical protein